MFRATRLRQLAARGLAYTTTRNVLGTVREHDGVMKGHTAARLAWSLWGVCVVFIVLPSLIPGENLPLFESLLVRLWIGTISGVGGLIASRQSKNPIGWIMIAIGVVLALMILARDYAAYALLDDPSSVPFGEVMAWLSTWVAIPAFALGTLFVLLFPDGRLLSPGWRPVAWITTVVTALMTVGEATNPGRLEGFREVENPVGFGTSGGDEYYGWVFFMLASLFIAGCCVAAVASQLVRLQRAPSRQRQQIKWFWYAAAFTLTSFLTSIVTRDLGAFLTVLGLLGMPIAIGIAILKHNLYDIDFIINRTLVYAALTATLALVYVGGVVGLGSLLREVTGGGRNNLVVAASTLAVAAMFRPARSRIQAFIDRRFYRSKHDAAKILERYSARLRDEISVDTVSANLLAVVDDTMQPSHASLWLTHDP